jgi:6-pyruvoyl-tetrahydropterin synthase
MPSVLVETGASSVDSPAAVSAELLAAEVTVVIGGTDFRFSAAHTGLHDGLFETMHGHTYIPTLTLCGPLDSAGMVADFRVVRSALRDAIAPLRSRILVAGHAGDAAPGREGDSVRLTDGVKTYVLPAVDVAVLPTTNTTTEQIAAQLLAHVAQALADSGVRRAVLELAESPGTCVTVATDLGARAPGRGPDSGPDMGAGPCG